MKLMMLAHLGSGFTESKYKRFNVDTRMFLHMGKDIIFLSIAVHSAPSPALV